jgi:hypothetical protein
MQLMAAALIFYAIAVFAVLGPTALPSALLLALVSILLVLRAWYLQIRSMIFADIIAESEK